MASRPPDRLAGVDRVLAWVTGLAAAFAVVVLFAGPDLIGAKKETTAASAGGAPAAQEPAPADATPDAGSDLPTEGPEETPEPAAAAADGEAVFASAGCGGCHTLATAGASGAIGPNLDDLKPPADTVKAAVTEGRGSMPSFSDRLSAEEIDAVAAYVAASAGG